MYSSHNKFPQNSNVEYLCKTFNIKNCKNWFMNTQNNNNYMFTTGIKFAIKWLKIKMLRIINYYFSNSTKYLGIFSFYILGYIYDLHFRYFSESQNICLTCISFYVDVVCSHIIFEDLKLYFRIVAIGTKLSVICISIRLPFLWIIFSL